MALSLEELENMMLEHPDPVVSAGDLADDVEETRRHVLDQLRLLERTDAVESKEIGARAVAWWHTDRVAPRRVPPEEHPEQSALDDVDADDRRDDPGGVDAGEHVPEDVVDQNVNALDLPGSGERLKRRRDAVRACYEFLRREGSASKSDFVADVYPEHTAGYDSPGGWWNAVGKQGLRDLARDDRLDVVAPGEGEHTWLFDS
jgi:hypothetical protein